MSNKLDLGLNDIIEQNRKTQRSSSNKGSRGGRGSSRGGRGGFSSRGRQDRRHNPIQRRDNNDGRSSSNIQVRDNRSSTQSSTQQPENRVRGDTIFVSGLAGDVNQDDVFDIFSRVGSVKSAIVNYDQNGTSLGTAEVIFNGSKDAETAVREYDGAEVDGKVMNVKLIGSFIKTPNIVKRTANAPNNDRQNRRQRNITHQNRRGGRGGSSRGSSHRGGSSRGGSSTRGGTDRRHSGKRNVSQADLDAELDAYQSKRGQEGASAGQPTKSE